MKKTKKKNLGDKIIVDENKYDINLDTSKNPFKGALIGGGIAAGTGIVATWGSLAACLMFDSVYLASFVTGQICTAGFTFLGGLAFTGIGTIIALPSLLGFGAYKIYQINKDKKRKEFFESFNFDKMKVEREVQLL